MRIDIGIIITGLFLFNVNGCPSSKSDKEGKLSSSDSVRMPQI